MNINAYSPQIIIGACAVVFAVLLVISWAIARQMSWRRTVALRSRYGREYDAALREYGSRRKAEAALEARLRHVEGLTLRPLEEAERRRYLADWDGIQARFVDHPRGAVTEADELINSVLRARGYSGGRFDQRVADISVYHARLVAPYRRANGIVAQAGRNEATTEELRSAMVLFREMFEELLETKTVSVASAEAA
jgi:hypothetical protein